MEQIDRIIILTDTQSGEVTCAIRIIKCQ